MLQSTCRQIWCSPLSAFALALILAGCDTAPKVVPPVSSPAPQQTHGFVAKDSRPGPVLPSAGSGRGGYYLDDGPGDDTPQGLQATPDAEPKVEPYSKWGNRPYVVFGKNYEPFTHDAPFKQRGVGSWYGKKFHGQKTSSGELYDMYKMTAAHPTLPIPSYARVTNVNNGVSVIVRINDRGPFHSSRVIDLSYTAALKLGYLGKGSSELEIERLLPEEIGQIARNRSSAPSVAVSRSVASAVPTPTSQTMTMEALLNTELMPMSIPEVAFDSASVMPVVSKVATSGVYLQLGSYAQGDNAHAARTRLLQSWATTYPTIEIVQSGDLYRLYSGPFSTRLDAAVAAQQMHDAGSVTAKPFIVQR